MTAMDSVSRRADLAKRQRLLVTPEGLALPLTLASRGARAAALLLDLTFIALALIVFVIAFVSIVGGLDDFTGEEMAPGLELVVVLFLLVLFLARFGYFMWFEMGPRGATPGKRVLGLRVAARGGGRLTAEAVIARNLMRDAEVTIPVIFLLSGMGEMGVMGFAAFAWLALFLLFPFFNRDNLRAGDLVAGTWLVESGRARLPRAMSVLQGAAPDFAFGEAELSVYGEHELKVLEAVLREDRPEALRKVMETICKKIGWEPGEGHERAFLEAFYSALRARLERDMRFGKRKADKHS